MLASFGYPEFGISSQVVDSETHYFYCHVLWETTKPSLSQAILDVHTAILIKAKAHKAEFRIKTLVQTVGTNHSQLMEQMELTNFKGKISPRI